jgi:DNA-binding response OmpR family regulator
MDNMRVLIVEENRRTVGELHDRLTRSGFETEVALTGETALTIVRERDVDAVVLDHSITGYDDWELVRKLKRRMPAIPILLINGPREKGVSRVARQAGATRFLRAPTELDRIVTALAMVLD